MIRGTMSLNELAVDLTCDPAPFTLPSAELSSSRAHTRSQLSQSNMYPRPDRISERSGRGREQQLPPPSNDEAISDELDEELENIPGSFPFPMDLSVPFPRSRKNSMRSSHAPRSRLASEAGDDTVYIVHGGMLRMTRAMGGSGKPVHNAVRDALRKNKGYCTFHILKICVRCVSLTVSQRLFFAGIVLVLGWLASSHW